MIRPFFGALVCFAGPGFGFCAGEVQAAPNPSYPPLRLAGPPIGATFIAQPTRNASVESRPAATPRSIVPDDLWCGVEAPRPVGLTPLPCKYPGLPCGPVSADQISRGLGEIGEDLDGDGQADLILAGHREMPKPETFAAIYRGTEAGFVLADYHPVPPRAEPTMASIVLAAPGSPPLLRDGYDIIEAGGRTVSTARLRRFDGQRFRTLLTFCSHRAEPTVLAPAGIREGHNRVEIVDIDKDGQKEIIIQGLISPTVFRFSDNGLGLASDPNLGQIYRNGSSEALRARTLRSEANRLLENGQVRRAAETLLRAQAATPQDLVLTLDLCGLLLRSNQAEKALELLARARFQAPEHAEVYCALGRAHRSLGDPAAERTALRTCLAKEPDDSLRAEATARLRELSP